MLSGEIRDKVKGLVRALASTARLSGIYGEGHKLVKEAADDLYAALEEVLTEKEEITIGVIGNEVAFEKEPFYEMSKQMESFIGHLKEIKAEKISFSKGLEKKELADFIAILSMKGPSSDKSAGFVETFASSGIRHIAVGKIGFKKEKTPPAAPREEINAIIERNYRGGIDFLEQALKDTAKNEPINTSSARRFVSSIISNLLRNKNLLLILTSTKSHDESTFVHDINVAIFTLLEAEALRLREDCLNDIGVAALLHDAGKLAISGDILRKKKRLTDDETQKISSHPVNGAKILLETPGVSTLAAIAAFEHHILYDMSGYPKRLYGKKINLAAMMIAIADYYDALRSKRAYHEEMAPERTYEDMMRLSGKYFHPDLLNNFFGIIGVYPPGTLVELDTSETGLVIKESALDIKRPQVEILYNQKGQKEKDPHIVNLLEKDKSGNYRRTIVKSIAPSDTFKIPGKYLP